MTPCYRMETCDGPRKSFNVGSFERASVEDFRERRGQPVEPGKMNIRWAKRGHVVSDIQEMHAEDGTDHATFQVMSNFNCLQYSSLLE